MPNPMLDHRLNRMLKPTGATRSAKVARCAKATICSLLLMLAAMPTGLSAFDARAGRPAAPASGSPRVSEAALKAMAQKLHRMAPKRALRKTAPGTASTLAGSFVHPGLTSGPLRNPAGIVPSLSRIPAGVQVHWSGVHGTPSFLTGEGLMGSNPAPAPGGSPAPAAVPAKALAYLEANREFFKLENPGQELLADAPATDPLGNRHVTFRQQYRGIPVWGGEITAHFGSAGALYAINASYAPTPSRLAPTGFRIGPDRAIAAARGDLSKRGAIEELGADLKALLEYSGPTAAKYVWIDQATRIPHWVWHVIIRPNFKDEWRYFVDAGSGAILEKYNATKTDGPAVATAADLLGVARNLNTYKSGANYYLIDATRPTFQAKSAMPNDPKGALWTLTAGNTDLKTVAQVSSANNAWTDPAAVSAHYNLGRVFAYFLDTFNRKGIDGAGSSMISAVHVTEGGKKMDNAFWSGKLMAYGDGNTNFKPLAQGLDVAAHEMTHGIIDATVNLEYKFQSGALNESMADVFGVMVDRDDWTLGEDVVNPEVYTSKAMRDIEHPHNGGTSARDIGWQPAHMDEFVQLGLDVDNGGVHVNSGIPNRACFLIADAIGREKTEKIYYRVLEARYLNPGSQFIDMRLAAIRSATDLFGAASAEVAAVTAGFNGVGIGGTVAEDKPTPRPQDVPPVAGQEFVAVVNADVGDNSLYIAKPVIAGDADIVQLTETQIYTGTGNPLAIPDDGSAVVFVDAANALRAIDDDGEQVVSDEGIWKSIAVSPDGAKVAATTLEPDAKIYILDLVNPDASKTVSLYTPTTGLAVKARNVVYADALDWNSTGEFLLYDAFNSVAQAEGDPIEYWDANLLEVKSEVITPFLPTRPEGVSIGNPSFAQTSDLNFVFDLFNEASGTYSVMAADLFTGGLQVIDSNGTAPGYPRYSTTDNILVYERAENGAQNVVQAPLAKDKITRSGATTSYIANGQKPNWFAIGKRPAGFPFRAAKRKTGPDLRLGADAKILFHLSVPADVEITVYDTFGRKVSVIERGRREAGAHAVRWDGKHKGAGSAAQGVYLVRLEAKPASGAPVSQTLKFARAD
jgi:bacillolysin